jgi:hypothetical protein
MKSALVNAACAEKRRLVRGAVGRGPLPNNFYTNICPLLEVRFSASKLRENYEILNVIVLRVNEQQIKANCSHTYAVACSIKLLIVVS